MTDSADAPWRDEETLRHLYWDRTLPPSLIAERLGCTARTVNKWMGRLGIPKRSMGENLRAAYRRHPPHFYTGALGYERVETDYRGERYRVKVHRLAAVAWYGWDAVVNNHIHHADPEGKDRPGIPWDNRESVIELLTPGEHASYHAKEGHSISNEAGLIAQHGEEAVLGDEAVADGGDR